MEQKVLHTLDLSFGYKNPLCAPISLNANSGEIICVIGRNGAGKSSLFNTLCGVLKPLSGDIFINGTNIRNINITKRSQLISFVPSKPEFTANLTVYELASMGRSPYTNLFDKKSQNDIEIVEKAIGDFNLKELSARPLWQLSDGEKQRAMICRAFIQQTPVIILDEPTAFLDYKMRINLLSDLRKLSQTENRCIIFSSHDIDPAVKISDKIWHIEKNEIREYCAQEFISDGILEKIVSTK
ncbi:MAG: ABC transporter ATP-binding protein [Bacteroidales bacterium]|nr:ABC transporter ATP-binding protein [Bacteroidales bacterium]